MAGREFNQRDDGGFVADAADRAGDFTFDQRRIDMAAGFGHGHGGQQLARVGMLR
ncbi:hypothetical protein D3C80_2128770 [compost metagenome]